MLQFFLYVFWALGLGPLALALVPGPGPGAQGALGPKNQKKQFAGPLADGVLDPEQLSPGAQCPVLGYLALAK